MTIETRLNIEKLTSDSIPSPTNLGEMPIVYVEGYYQPGDGGGGIFIYDANSTTVPDLGINFRSSHGSGRWVRQYDGYLNVAYFGITKYPKYQPAQTVEQNGERLQKAIDYCHSNLINPPSIPTPDPDLPYYPIPPKSFTIYFPEGSYWIERTIIIRTGTHLKGDNGTQVNLQDNLLDITTKLPIEYMFEIEEGTLEKVSIENFRFDCGAVRNNEALEVRNYVGWLRAKAIATFHDGGYSGGLTLATFKDLKITGVGGHGIELSGGFGEGGGTGDQFVYFDNVWVERTYNYKNSLRMTDTNLNMSFTNCAFAAPFVESLNSTKTTLLGASVYINSESPNTPINNQRIMFIGSNAGGTPGQPAEYGFQIENAINILIDTCWLEDIEIGISVKNSNGVSIINNHFANAAAHGSRIPSMFYDPRGGDPENQRNAECIAVEDSFVTIERNDVLVSDIHAEFVWNERFIRGIGNNNTINSRNNFFNGVIVSQTFGITQNITITKIESSYKITPSPLIRGINTDGKKLALIKKGTEGNKIFRINSSINAGELLYLFAEDEDIIFYQMSSNEMGGKNISLSGHSSVTLNQGEGATFIKIDRVINDETSVYQMIAKF